MQYKKEFSIDSFEFWSGAKSVIDTVRKAGKLDELQTLIEEQFQNETPNATKINDFVWFNPEYIYECLGLNENAEPEQEED